MAAADSAGARGVVDLRSDTLTKPTPGMREAIATAQVGDDVFGEDPTVAALEVEVAALFGHEAALFTPTGSMANQIAVQLLVPPGDELICDVDAHIVTYELGAAAVVGGVSTRTWAAAGAAIDVEAVGAMISGEGYYLAPTRAIAVEQTHNRSGGAIIALSTLQELRRLADSAGIAMHCDGARIWHAHIADGVPLAGYGRLFETVSVCLSKGLGAPIGSVLISSAERIAGARLIRKRMGGGMRQVGVLAAAGRYALANHLERLAEDHARARRIAEALAPYGVVDPATVRTNFVLLDVGKAGADRGRWNATSLAAAAREQGVLIGAVGPRTARLVTHLDLDDAGIDRAIEVLTALLARP